MQFYVSTRTHVRQFTLVHVAKCHSTISWIMSSYFPMTGFKATVCASTRDNWHNIQVNHFQSHTYEYGPHRRETLCLIEALSPNSQENTIYEYGPHGRETLCFIEVLSTIVKRTQYEYGPHGREIFFAEYIQWTTSNHTQTHARTNSLILMSLTCEFLDSSDGVLVSAAMVLLVCWMADIVDRVAVDNEVIIIERRLARSFLFSWYESCIGNKDERSDKTMSRWVINNLTTIKGCAFSSINRWIKMIWLQ